MKPKPSRARGSVTADDFVSAALDVTRRDGLGEVSLRRLAAELGLSHMAVYKHHADKDALVEAMIDRVMGSIATPPLVAEQWAQWIEQVGLEIVTVLGAHPGLADAVLTRIPNRLTPNGVALTARCVDALAASGLDRELAGTAFLVMFAYFVGSVRLQNRTETHAGRPDQLPDSIHRPFDNEQFLIGLRLLMYGIQDRAPHHR
ncbi:MAG TPA: TetR/AcrR family transcriptional regulator [Pseudonocardia sp.]|jgi:AcrR family transcriptional regulator